MTRKPVIILTARDAVHNNNRTLCENDSYFNYIEAAGGLPLMAGEVSETEAQQLADLADGLVVTGGPDVDPALYGEANTHSFLINAALEDADRFLYHAFRRRNKPVFGICRGMQAIAVFEGGALLQDIPTEYPGFEHNQMKMDPPVPRECFAHDCLFAENTLLHEIFGDRYGVNTFHHQAVTRLPEGFVLSARSDDGLIEGFEKENVIAVQWHPERLIADEKHLELAKRFIAMCR